MKKYMDRVLLSFLFLFATLTINAQTNEEQAGLKNRAQTKIIEARQLKVASLAGFWITPNNYLPYKDLKWAETAYEALNIYQGLNMKDSAFAAFAVLTMTPEDRSDFFNNQSSNPIKYDFDQKTKEKLKLIFNKAYKSFEKTDSTETFTATDSLILRNVYDIMVAEYDILGEYKLSLSLIQKALLITINLVNGNNRNPILKNLLENKEISSRIDIENYYKLHIENANKVQKIDSLNIDLELNRLIIAKDQLEKDKKNGELKILSQEKEIQNLLLSQKDKELTQQKIFSLSNAKKADSLSNVTIIKNLEIEKQSNVKNAFIAGFLVVLIFSFTFFVQRNRIYKEKLYSEKERKRSDTLLLNILPSEVAEELKSKGESEAKQFDDVTVLLSDFVNFTGTSERLTPKELVGEIHHCFTGFDEIIERNGLEKIKTTGDAYLAVCGLPNADEKHAKKVVVAAQEMLQFMNSRKNTFKFKDGLEVVRIGINSGSVVAGIVGVKKFAYDIWGDTVNIAARMEQNGEPGKINISGATYQLVKNDFKCTHRGKIEAKNKGMIDMYYIELEV